MEDVKIYNNDCLVKLKELKVNSIDTIITDPPYGISFMGKKWDYDVPSVEIWEECLRVTKPGGTLLCFAGTRTQHRMACNLEDAGWVIKDCIMWIYGTGFPKSHNIGKQIDKKQGNERTPYERPDFVARSNKTEQRNSQVPCGEKGKYTKGNSEWEGFGTALKPAYEPILVCMKSNEGSYVDNALKWGVAGLNIDESRVGIDIIPTIKRRKAVNTKFMSGEITPEHLGRFPANIILDEEAGKILDNQSGLSKSNIRKPTGKDVYGYGAIIGKDKTERGITDKGGASRFFYCAKASKVERNLGCEHLEESDDSFLSYTRWCKDCNKTYNGSNDHSNCSGKYIIKKSDKNILKNNHPTVKPIKLMEYLCNLTKTPSGGVVLDPFLGSGSTGIACINIGRKFIGIERDKNYFKIAQARLIK